MKAYLLLIATVFATTMLSGCSTIKDAPSGEAKTPLPAITTLPTGTATTSPGPGPTLPQALYFLAETQEVSQVWRLGMDGSSTTQITNEQAKVDAFDVSPATGEIAFISDNRLFIMDDRGGERLLIADGHTVDQNMGDYAFRSQVSSPVFSPDGRTLAYGFNGLHLYDLDSGQDTHVLTNLGNLLGEPYVFSKEVYVPGDWSPDGSMLLIIMGYYEGSTLAVMDLEAEQPFRRLWSDGPVCCFFSWSSDGSSVLVADPSFTGNIPGLWRFDAETGEQSVVVYGLMEDGSSNFVGWPLQLSSGELLYFHVNERFSPDTGIPLTMVRSDLDGSQREEVRPDAFHIIEALWVQDGSMAVILQPADNATRQIILARTNGEPLQILYEGNEIGNLRWGP